MTENKRFEIKPSAMYNNKYVIHDSEKEYTFPILDSTLNYMFCKAMNELHEENEQLQARIGYLERKIQRERNSTQKQYEKWEKEAETKIKELSEENEQLKQAIAETEKMVQSTYDELTKLRCFKKNILRIKHSWDYLMEAIQYD